MRRIGVLLVVASLWSTSARAQAVVSGGGSLPPPGTSGNVLTSNGSGWTSSAVSGAGLGDASTNTATSVDSEVVLFSGGGGKTLKRATGSGFPLFTSGVITWFTPGTGVQTFLTTPSGANLLAALTTKTGTGLPVFGTSPALTTPDLGTPSALTLTNATACAVSTCVGGLAANMAAWLADATSAKLRAAVSDESGTGALLFAGGALGAATATTINKVTITAPATASTLTIPDGVTMTGPAASGTVATLGNTNTFTGRQDASGAASTSPMKSGTAAPGTCTVGDQFFDTDATAGSNLLGCTATNTWTAEAGGAQTYPGSGVAVSNGSAWTTSLTAPASALVGLTDSQTLTNKTLTTPTIGSFTNATHDHSNAAGGGTLSPAALPTTITENALTGNTTISAYGVSESVSCSGCTIELPTVTAQTGSTDAVCADDASAGTVILDGNGSQTLNGATTRVMVPGECANLVVRAGEWKKISGRTIALTARLSGGAASKTAGSWQVLTTATQASGSTLLFDDPNDRITIPRAGTYAVSVTVLVDTPANQYFIGISKNGSIDFTSGPYPAYAGTTYAQFGEMSYQYAAGDYVSPMIFPLTTTANVTAVDIQIHEINPW